MSRACGKIQALYLDSVPFKEMRVLISFKCVSGLCVCTGNENRLIYVSLMLKDIPKQEVQEV